MAFKSASEFTKPNSRAARTGARLTISTDLAHIRKGGNACFALRFSLSEELLKEARIIPGDRVDVLFDEGARLGLIRRISKGGWAVGLRGKRKVIQLTWTEGLPSVPSTTPCEAVSVTEEGIMFELPEAVQFGECARTVEEAA